MSVIQNDVRTDDSNQELEEWEMDNTLVQYSHDNIKRLQSTFCKAGLEEKYYTPYSC